MTNPKRTRWQRRVFIGFIALLLYFLVLPSRGWTETEPITYEDERIAIETIILEARGESLEGQIAVGEVIRNRAFKANSSVGAICMATLQFSCWNEPLIASSRLARVSPDTWQRASRAWAESERLSVLGSGYCHYHAVGVYPKWARGQNWKRIGAHLFYRGIK